MNLIHLTKKKRKRGKPKSLLKKKEEKKFVKIIKDREAEKKKEYGKNGE